MRSLTFIYSVMNFLILIFLLHVLLRKKLKKFLLDRRDNYISKKEETQALYRSTAEKLDRVKLKLSNVDIYGKDYIDKVSDQSNKDSTMILQKAINIRDRIVYSRQRSLEADIKDFKKLIRSRVATKILEKTEDRILEKPAKGLTDMYIDEYSGLSNTDRGTR